MITTKPEHLDSFFETRSPITTGSEMVIGGTWLLKEFFGIVASCTTSSRLMITSPFVGDRPSVEFESIEALDHSKTDLWFVTRNSLNSKRAIDAFRNFSWRSLLIAESPRLHSKLFAFSSTGGYCVTLLGSHNLTRGGIQENLEAGVLFVTTTGSKDIEAITHSCQIHIFNLVRSENIVFDSTKWPQTTEID